MASIGKPKFRVFVSAAMICLLNLGLQLSAQSESGSPRLMQGPMVGAVYENEINIWVRTSGAFPVSIEYGTDRDLHAVQETEPVLASKSLDYTLVIKLKNALPDTPYFYRVKVNGRYDRYTRELPPFQTKTAPRSGAARNFRLAFGSCVRFQMNRIQPVWSTIHALAPDLFFWLGDNIYGDATDPDILREEYRRQRDVHSLQPLLAGISNLAIWDDHDYGLNNHNRTHPGKAEALAVFKEYWANPSYGLEDEPGVFFRHAHGQVDFFFLDGRYSRDPNKSSNDSSKSMLGKKQFEWLKAGLKNSRATFKLLISGSGWTLAKGEAGDSWAAFLSERNALFDFIRDHAVSGVVLLSGDTHVGELNVIPWSQNGGYDFYELASSPLSQRPSSAWLQRRPERRIRPVYAYGDNFGVIDFVFGDVPKLVFRLIDSGGRLAWEPLEVEAKELVNGVVSWPAKVDENENARQENYEQGNGYYERID
ncbi:MAG: alkaline phosphatase D family protein [bacterium]